VRPGKTGSRTSIECPADDHTGPAAVGILEVSEQPTGLDATFPGHGSRLSDVEELGNDSAAQRFDELGCVAELPSLRRLGVLVVFG
jgi:hypothetical protein